LKKQVEGLHSLETKILAQIKASDQKLSFIQGFLSSIEFKDIKKKEQL